MLILRPPWTSQPQGAVNLSPLALRAAVLVSSNGGSIQDLISGGLPASGNGTRADGVAQFGRARVYSGGSDFFATPASLNAPTSYTWLVRARVTNISGFNGIFTKTSNLGTTNGFGSYTDGPNLNITHDSGAGVSVEPFANITGAGVCNICVVWTGSQIRYFRDGRLVSANGYTTAVTSGNGYLKVLSNRDISTSSGEHDLTAVWPFALSDEEAIALTDGVGVYSQLFRPRSIWVPVSAGGPDVTQALSGASATSQAGTLAPTITAALSGAAASFAAGTVAPTQAVVQALTGVSATAQTGTLPASITAVLSGASATWQAGNVTSGSDVVAALSGVSATFAQGTEAVSISVALSGTASTFAAGTVAPAQAGTAQLTGVSTAVQAGTLAPTITRALSGLGSTFAAGTVAPTQAAVQSLTGQAATYATGTLAPTITVALSGQAVNSARGTVSPTQANTQALSGVSATLATGTLAPSVSATVALSGLGVTVSPGVVGLPQSATVALVGQSLSAVLGNLYIIGAWTPVNDAAGNTWAPVNDTSSNGWTPITWG